MRRGERDLQLSITPFWIVGKKRFNFEKEGETEGEVMAGYPLLIDCLVEDISESKQ